MKLAALVSGGKDSIFAAALCENHGWDVGELVTLIPDDEDSYLYHTPNLHVVPLIAKAWGKRHVAQGVEGRGEEAELAFLVQALTGVKERGFTGVTIGAIASGYQWARVWHAARMVGIEVFAPLWRASPEAVLLGEVAMGLDARIVATASEPLTEDILGRSIDGSLVARLKALSDGGQRMNVAGEGGEYETLVLSAPFLKQRVVIDEFHVQHRGNQARWVVDRASLADT